MKRQEHDAHLEDDIAKALATGRFAIVDGRPGYPSADTVARLEAAYRRAHRAEVKFVDALGKKPSERALAHAWKLAERSNAALRALRAARNASEGK